MVPADELTLAKAGRVVRLVPAARPRPDRLAGRRPSWRGAKFFSRFECPGEVGMVAADESTLARVNRVVRLVPAARPRPDRLAGRRPSWRGPKVNEGFLWNPM
jgi:antitoxin (DNA-binding transcriptional repressor) of toxin-antitoxin stability system